MDVVKIAQVTLPIRGVPRAGKVMMMQMLYPTRSLLGQGLCSATALMLLFSLSGCGDSLDGNVWDGRTPVCDADGVIRGDVELYQSDVIVELFDGTNHPRQRHRPWHACGLHNGCRKSRIGTKPRRQRARTRP